MRWFAFVFILITLVASAQQLEESNIWYESSVSGVTNTITVDDGVTKTTIDGVVAKDVILHGPSTIFGDFPVTEDTPLVQVDALQGVTSDFEVFTATGGSVTHKTDHGGKEFEAATGVSVGGYGLIRSKRAVRYRPGQGVKIRYTARFGSPVALLAQRAGAIGVGTELSFGHDGSNGFGVLHRTGGRLEVRTLTVTTPAGGAETLTVTLDGTAYSVNATAGTAAHNAFEIATDSDFGIDKTWQAYQNGSTVIFMKSAVGTATGSYSIASTGALVGNIVQTEAGTAVTDTWVYQGSWDNPTPFGATSFDPTKGNVYEIEFGYLGYAGIKFKILNPNSNQFVTVHTIKYPNSYAVPHLDIPNFKIGWFAASLGSSTDTSVFGASAAGFVSGKRETLRNPIAHGNTKTGVTTTLTNILSIRVRPEMAGFVNLNEVLPTYASVAVDGTKPVGIEIHINPTFGGEPNWTYHDQTNSIVEYDTTATTVTGGKEIAVIGVSKDGNGFINLKDYNVRLSRNDILTLAAKATSATSDVTGSLGWIED